MDPLLKQLIMREEQKLQVLEARLSRLEARIALLQEIAQEDGDECVEEIVLSASPKASTVENKTEGPTKKAQQDQIDSDETPRRKPSRKSIRLLKFIGTKGKSLDELENFAREANFGMNRSALRSFANFYSSRFKLLKSVERGRFRLTETGTHYLDENFQEKDGLAFEERLSLTSDVTDIDDDDEL